MIQIIFGVSMYPVLLILYFVMRGLGDTKNGFCFGVRLEPEQRADEGVQAVITGYRKELKWVSIVLAIIPVITFFIPYFSICITIWMIWLLAVIAVPYIPYMKAYRAVLARKLACGWGKTHTEGERKLVELKSAGKVRRVRLAPFLPPIAFSTAAAVWSLVVPQRKELPVMSVTVVIFAVTTLMLYGLAVWMDHQKTEVISEDSEVNLNYARARKNIWKNFWLAGAWLNTIFTIFTAASLVWFERVMSWILWGSIGYTAVITVFAFILYRSLMQVDRKYAGIRQFADSDDDAHWLWGGMVYYNKNDRHILVNRRVGIGTTFNMATPFGMGITLFGIAVLIITIPVCCGLMLVEEFTPISLTVKNGVLVAEHWKVEYEIPLDDIIDVELFQEHPRWSKVNGTGMENLSKGTFRIRNEGNVEVFLNPQNSEFLCIETADGIYWMSDIDDDGTLEIYNLLE